MDQPQPNRMQCLTRKLLQRGSKLRRAALRGPRSATIKGIANQRMPDVRHVHTNLMCSTCLEFDGQEAVTREGFENPIVRYSLAAIANDRHLDPLCWVPPNGRIHAAASHEMPLHQCAVLAVHCAGLQLVDQRIVRLQRLGDHEQTARVLVEPMHDAGARNCRECRFMMQQRILQRPIGIPSCGMDDQARRLVDDQKLLVLVDEVECDRLGQTIALGFEFSLHANRFATPDLVAAAARTIVDQDLSRVDPLLEPTARKLGHQGRERLIEPTAGQGRIDLQMPLHPISW